MLQPWSEANDSRIDVAAESDIEWVKELMLGLRKIRAEMNIGPGKPLQLFLKNATAEDQRRLTENEALLKKLAKIESFSANRTKRRSALACWWVRCKSLCRWLD